MGHTGRGARLDASHGACEPHANHVPQHACRRYYGSRSPIPYHTYTPNRPTNRTVRSHTRAPLKLSHIDCYPVLAPPPHTPTHMSVPHATCFASSSFLRGNMLLCTGKPPIATHHELLGHALLVLALRTYPTWVCHCNCKPRTQATPRYSNTNPLVARAAPKDKPLPPEAPLLPTSINTCLAMCGYVPATSHRYPVPTMSFLGTHFSSSRPLRLSERTPFGSVTVAAILTLRPHADAHIQTHISLPAPLPRTQIPAPQAHPHPPPTALA